MPKDREMAAMVTLRWFKPAAAIIWMPLTMMAPNIITVQPPSTGAGREAKKAPMGWNMLARIMQAAPVMMVKRFTTRVMAIRPTFWLKEVMGVQPKREEMELAKPSQAKEPEISFSLISLFRPAMVMAEVSPMVSAADTRKMMATETMAPQLNSGAKGRKAGREKRLPLKICDRSTMPAKMETM